MFYGETKQKYAYKLQPMFQENDWHVFIMTLIFIKKRLCNRQLIEECTNVKSITKQLINIVVQLSNLRDTSERILQNLPADKKYSDLKAYIFPVRHSLVLP